MSTSDEHILVETVVAIGGLKIQIWNNDFQHALEGHPEVTLERIRFTLTDPIKVIQSKYSKRACLFYSLEYQDEITKEIIYFCVVVGVLGDGIGKLETAYETTYIKKGEEKYSRKLK